MKCKWLKVLSVLACLTFSAGLAACGMFGGDNDKDSSSSTAVSSSSNWWDSSSESSISSTESNSSSEEILGHTAGIVYEKSEDGTYSVTGYTGTATKVVIASQYQGIAVTSISEKAFHNCSNLTEIVIPDSVTSIGENAFSECESLMEIIIPDSVANVGESAFSDCARLIVYCETINNPSGWVSWNPSGRPIVWDCNNNDVATDGYVYMVIDGLRYVIKDGVYIV